jgi:uncharacterized membrane protein YdjX (TVP38/TMEM64 family)
MNQPQYFFRFLVPCVVLAIAWYLDLFALYGNINIHSFRETILSYGIFAPLVYIIICSILPNLFFPFSLIIVTGGYLFGTTYGIIFSYIGCMVSAVVGYMLPVLFEFEKIKKKFLKKYFFQIEDKLSKYSILSALIIRNVGLPLGAQNYLSSIAGIKFSSYIIGSGIAFIPWVVGLTILGESFLTLDVRIIILALLFVLCIYTGIYFLMIHIQKKYQ